MKIIDLTDQAIYEIDIQKNGENYMPCPACNSNRKHKGAKSFSWNNAKRIGYCQNCTHKFVEFKPLIEQKVYVKPIAKNTTSLSDIHLKAFENRCISQDTVKKMGIYSDSEFMPQDNKVMSVVCFPYYVDTELVNIKYRAAGKHFKLVKDAELVFYNQDAISKFSEIIITEGEFDALAWIDIKIENVISLPAGANLKNAVFIDKYIDLFEGKKIVLSTDNDLPGIEARSELIRRFGAERCYTLNFKDCKDANEYKIKYGDTELRFVYERKEEVPIAGIVNLNSHYDDVYKLFVNGLTKGLGFDPESDSCVTWETGRLAIWTGIPSHGKSEFLDFFNVKMNVLHGWKTAYFSPENYPVQYHFAKICSKLTGVDFSIHKLSTQEFNTSFDYISNNFYFIAPDEQDTIELILEKTTYLIRKHGVKQLVIDPYNKITHSRDRGMSETEYIGQFLDKLIVYARRNDILIHLIAHPTKMKKDSGGIKYEIPTLYDINGSANFYNKADYGIVIYRHFGDEPKVQVIYQKVKFKHLGEGGEVYKKYIPASGRYVSLSDFSNYSDSYLNTDKTGNQMQEYSIEPTSLQPSNTFETNVKQAYTSEDVPF